jgi:triosephosphate isomerase
MRKRYLIGNLKMYLTLRAEAEQYLTVLAREAEGRRYTRTVFVLCPSFVHLASFASRPEHIRLGAQDVFFEKDGAYTGEISVPMLRDAGSEYVIIGHSERRLLGGDSDEVVRRKSDAALRGHLLPIVCIGETAEERAAGTTEETILRELHAVFEGLPKMQAEKIILAYEPRWAIGTDRTPSTEEIFSVRVLIRKWLTEHFDAATEERIAVIYGGSVKRDFLPAVSYEAGMDGVLVGRESMYPSEMVRMADLLESAENNP